MAFGWQGHQAGKRLAAVKAQKNMYYHIRDNQIVAGPEETAAYFREHWKAGDYLYSQTMKDVWVWEQSSFSWVQVTGDEADKVRLAMMLLL